MDTYSRCLASSPTAELDMKSGNSTKENIVKVSERLRNSLIAYFHQKWRAS